MLLMELLVIEKRRPSISLLVYNPPPPFNSLRSRAVCCAFRLWRRRSRDQESGSSVARMDCSAAEKGGEAGAAAGNGEKRREPFLIHTPANSPCGSHHREPVAPI